MKLIASDYDGTLYRNGEFTAADKKAVKIWQEKGNLFGMATGRGYFMGVYYLPKDGFDCDFYICKNGAAIYNKSGDMLSEKTFSGTVLRELIPFAFSYGCLDMGFEYQDQRWEVLNDRNRGMDDGVFRLPPEELATFMEENGIILHQADSYWPSAEAAQTAADAINGRFAASVCAHMNRTYIDITANAVSKATGICDYLAYLKEHDGVVVDRKDVIPVGDSYNDLEMIIEFNGVTVKNAVEHIQAYARKAYFDFEELVFDHLFDLPETIDCRDVFLRRFCETDKQRVYEILQDGEMHRYLLDLPKPYMEWHASGWINMQKEEFSRNIKYTYAVVEKQSGDLCGSVSLTNIKKHQKGELGYWIARPYWKNGYCSQAVNALLRLAFLDLDYHKVVARCFDTNIASAKVLLRAGFEKEGLLKESFWKDGSFSDEAIYGMTKTAYMQKNGDESDAD